MKFKKTLPFFLFLISYFGYTQDRYVDIPKTRVSMIKPPDYELMKYQTGLKKDELQTISITDLLGGNYYSNAKDFDRTTFETQGVNVKEFSSVTINGFPGKILLAEMNYTGMDAIMLVFGDSTFSTMIRSVFNPNENNAKNEIKKSLLSIKYNKNKIVDPFENIMFSADTMSTDFRFSMFSGNMYTFSAQKKDNISEELQMVSIVPLDSREDESLKELSTIYIEKMREKGFMGILTDDTSKKETDEYDIFSAYGSCYVEFDKYFFYQIILSKEDLCLVGNGLCKYDNEKAKEDIIRFCNSIKIKTIDKPY